MKLNYIAGMIPTKYELTVGAIAYNVPDGIMYTKLIDDTVIVVGGIGGSGENANGTWSKLPDGMLICRGEISITDSIEDTWTFPMTFAGDMPDVYHSKHGGGTGAPTATIAGGATLTTVLVNVWGDAQGTIIESAASISLLAIGRWKA